MKNYNYLKFFLIRFFYIFKKSKQKLISLMFIIDAVFINEINKKKQYF